MKIAFLDPFKLDYVVSTPYSQPLGGAESSLCYLAVELARLGNEVVLVNNTTAPGVYLGVNCINIDLPGALEELCFFDCIVVLNVPVGWRLRSVVGAGPRLILWSGDAHDMPRAQKLRSADERGAWDAFVFKSDWQRREFAGRFGIPAARAVVLRNAIGPHFANLFAGAAASLACKQDPPALAYTSTPFRGLEVLLDVFPSIRAQVPGVVLKVYSSMRVYQWSADRDPHAGLYERCRGMPGVEYIGSLSQPELARALCPVSILAYPSTYAETSCNSVMEAIAAGCRVVTSDLGALPETTAGHAILVRHRTKDETPGRFAADFLAATLGALGELASNPQQARDRAARAIEHFNASATWPRRALEWVHWLETSN